ncbi:MAG: BON domain-containing protein [Acidobacteriota bacterium]
MKDSIIRNKIKHFFNMQSVANLARVDVSVNNGEVILEGVVYTREEKRFAENIIKQMWDVTKLDSKLKLLSEATTISLPPLHTVLQNVG